MEVAVYKIRDGVFRRLNLFSDEKIEINNLVKNISDISKIRTDFSQGFTIPADPINNPEFEYWFDDAVDGQINFNLRQDAYIEVGSYPFRFGCIQLDQVKFKSGKPDSYMITFYSNAVNLYDLFGDDELSGLDLSAYDHDYTPEIVLAAMLYPTLAGGHIYYPLINAANEMSVGTTGDRDLIDPANAIEYREFKPAIRDLKIIEAIEAKYGVTFSRDFFDRAVFYDKFTWMHRESGYMKAYGVPTRVNIINGGNLNEIDMTVNVGADTVSYQKFGPGNNRRQMLFTVYPEAGFEEVPYKMIVENNGVIVLEIEVDAGANTVVFSDGVPLVANVLKFYVSPSADFDFHTRLLGRMTTTLGHTDRATYPTTQSAAGHVYAAAQMPELKVKDYLNSLISEFNLVLRPTGANSFYVDTLDNWYSKGRAWNITKYVDNKSKIVSRPDIKKRIDFLYQKAGAILGAKYLENNAVGYGDLRAVYDVAGSELKIESQFENMLFERLQNESTGDLSDVQAGYAIDKKLDPYIGKPFSFYRCGYTDAPDGTPFVISGQEMTRFWHTASENNLQVDQVSSSRNFGADISSYFYIPVEKGLYANNWKTYIEELFNKKTRAPQIKAKLPAIIVHKLQLNDRFIIGDKKYKQSVTKIDITTGDATLDLFSDLGPPFDSVQSIDPITVDSTLYTVDSEILTVDMVSVHRPDTSYTVNGVDRTEYQATAAEENFEVRISANTNWTVAKIDTGDGVDWFATNKTTGNRSDFLRVTTALQLIVAPSYRTGILRIIIDGATFDLTISQNV